MNSGEAHGWLFVSLINDHLWPVLNDEDYNYAPDECGPCQALRDYFNDARGRAEAQSYMNRMSAGDREWEWAPDGVIDWDMLEQIMSRGSKNG